MNQFTIVERQQILSLALEEAFRKRDEIRQKINELTSVEEDYQEMIDNIRDWQDELK